MEAGEVTCRQDPETFTKGGLQQRRGFILGFEAFEAFEAFEGEGL